MRNGLLYAGFTGNLRRRLQEHMAGRCNTTSKYLPVVLIYYEAHRSELDARRRERYFKTTKGKATLRLMLRNSLNI